MLISISIYLLNYCNKCFIYICYLSAPSLQIYDGDSMSFPLVGTFCGNAIPASIASTSNFLTVRFVTDGSVNKRGFNATYRTMDSKTLTLYSNSQINAKCQEHYLQYSMHSAYKRFCGLCVLQCEGLKLNLVCSFLSRSVWWCL